MKTVHFNGRRAIPHSICAGVAFDNGVEQIMFDLPQIADGQTETLHWLIAGNEGTIILANGLWTIYDTFTQYPGEHECYIEIWNNDTLLWHSQEFMVHVAELPDVNGGGGAANYDNLTNKPKINGVELLGNKSLSDLGAAAVSDIPTKASDLEDDSGHYTKPACGIPDSDIASSEKWDAKYNKPDMGIPATDLAANVIPDITGKADKVSTATEGNFAALDANGNLIDSGHKHSDYLTEHQDISGKLDAPPTTGTTGQVPRLASNGEMEWSSEGQPTDEQVGTAVSTWLNAHPEATTTVVDGSITKAKLDSNLKETVDDVAELKSQVTELEQLNPNGTNFDLSGAVNGVWKNASIGDTIATATNNNCKRIMVDLSGFIGCEAEIAMTTTQGSTGPMNAFCDSNGVIYATKYEYDWKSTPVYKFTVTANTSYVYIAYTIAKTSSVSVKAISNVGKNIASIPTMQNEIDRSAKSISFENICENANIDDTTGFIANGASTFSVADNVLTMTPIAQNAEVEYTIPMATVAGHKYYASVSMKTLCPGTSRARFRMYKTGVTTKTNGSVSVDADGSWHSISFVMTDNVGIGETARLSFHNNSASNWENIYIRQIVIIDLSAVFGVGNEPNRGAVDGIIKQFNNGNTFFEGSLSTNVLLNSIYPNEANNKPIYVGISGYVMNVNAKYSANKDIRYKIGKAGSNSLFNWRGIDYIDNSNQIVSPEVDLAQTITVITDWFGPHKLKAANNIDGDMPSSDNFTGGNHAYNGDSSGTPTARTAFYAFYVDGRKVTEFADYAYYVDVYWQNFVQATNTKKSDGTGREVLKETFHMHFDGEKWTLNGMLEPLEALASWSYYGIQMSRGSAYNGYIFYHDSPDNRTWHATNASSAAGSNTCRTITMHDGADYFDMHVGYGGLGNFALNPNDSSFFSTDSKTYSNLIKGATSIAANSVYTYDGWYKWYNMSLT